MTQPVTSSSNLSPVHRSELNVGWLARPVTGPIVLGVAAITMVAWTWGRYGHPFVDFGREIYVAWRLSAGEVLYRDIDYFNGPVSPYLNALILRIFGASLQTLEIANLLWWVLLVTMAYRIYVAMSDRLSAFAVTLMFIALFSFVQLTYTGNYNFIAPYAHEVTHGLVCGFALLSLLWSYIRQSNRPNQKALVGCGLLLGMMFLMKAEVTIAAVGALLVGVSLRLFFARANPKQWLAAGLMLVLAALVPVLLAIALLRLAMPWQQALSGVVGGWKYLQDKAVTGSRFYRHLFGTDNLSARVLSTLKVLACELLLLAPASVVAMLIPRNSPKETRAVWAVGVAGCVIVMLWIFWDSANWAGSMLPLNLVAVCSVVTFAAHLVRQRKNPSPRLIMQVCFSVFATLLLSKIFFNVAIYHYGFALAGPAFGLLVMLLLSWIPDAISRRGGDRWIFIAAAIAALGAFTARHLLAYESSYRSVPVQMVGSGADRFAVYDSSEAINLVLGFLDRVPAGQTVATIPQGALINYLSRRVNPTGEITLLPGEVQMFGERRILDRFKAHPPDWIVTVQTNFSEFGFKGFGIDYAQDIARFIKDNYEPVPLGESDLKWNLGLERYDPGYRLRRAPNRPATSPESNSPVEAGDASHPQ